MTTRSQKSGVRIQGTKFKSQGSGFRIRDSGSAGRTPGRPRTRSLAKVVRSAREEHDGCGNMTCVQNASANGPCPQWKKASISSEAMGLGSPSAPRYNPAGHDRDRVFSGDCRLHRRPSASLPPPAVSLGLDPFRRRDGNHPSADGFLRRFQHPAGARSTRGTAVGTALGREGRTGQTVPFSSKEPT